MSGIVIRGVVSPDEHEYVCDLVVKVHYSGYFAARGWFEEFINNYPEYRPDHTRILAVDGQIAACLTLFTHTVRIGESRLKMGGIGHVTTAGPFRNRGYAAKLLEDTLRFMGNQGYHVSTLFGIADFYHRWGFASVLPEYASVVEVREALAGTTAGGKQRPIKPGDISAIQRIHTQNDVQTACSSIRSSGHFSNRWQRWKQAHVLMDPRGKVVAYYLGAAQGSEYRIEELGVSESCWCGPLLNVCASRAAGEYASSLRFFLPPLHPFAEYLLQFKSDHETHLSRNSNGMMAVVDIAETLECMTAEWENLLSRFAATPLSGEFTLVVDRLPFRVRVRKGLVDIAQAPGENKISLSSVEFMQLLSGYRHLEEILATKRRAVGPAAGKLLGALFPKRSPYMWLTDRF